MTKSNYSPKIYDCVTISFEIASASRAEGSGSIPGGDTKLVCDCLYRYVSKTFL